MALFILADHGNAETMLTPDGKPITSHSTSAVPFVGALPVDCPLKFNRATVRPPRRLELPPPPHAPALCRSAPQPPLVDARPPTRGAQGGVADVAPTMLTYMGIDIPKEMTGKSFL